MDKAPPPSSLEPVNLVGSWPELPLAVLILTLFVYNVALILMFQHLLTQIDVREATSEKDPDVVLTAQIVEGDTSETPEKVYPTSFSRLAGALGAMVLACFFWGLGNVIFYFAFANIGIVTQLGSALGWYFLAGSALFAPYAFKQLGQIFNAGPTGTKNSAQTTKVLAEELRTQRTYRFPPKA
jgi:hypothetical protein